MKEFILNKNSWHYKLSRFGLDNWYPDHSDLCSYIRRIGFVIALLVAFTSVAIIAIFLEGKVIAEGSFDFPGKFETWTLTQIFLAFLIGFVLDSIVFGTIFLCLEFQREIGEFLCNYPLRPLILTVGKIVELVERDPDEDNPGFIILAYRSFKDKTCVKIKFKKE